MDSPIVLDQSYMRASDDPHALAYFGLLVTHLDGLARGSAHEGVGGARDICARRFVAHNIPLAGYSLLITRTGMRQLK